MHSTGKEERREFVRWWFIGGLCLLATLGALGFFGAFLKLFHTRVEREVLVTSHQYQEARSSEVTTYEAQLAELRGRLNRGDLSDDQRAEVEAQISSINIQLTAARARQ